MIVKVWVLVVAVLVVETLGPFKDYVTLKGGGADPNVMWVACGVLNSVT